VLNSLLSFIASHTSIAYIAVFLISLSESLALVGLFVPGTFMMFGIGAIVASGVLQLNPVIGLAIAGAIVGDGFSYWLGYHYHQQLRTIWPFSRFPGLLQKGEIFFTSHGGKSVLFGRFVGPVRPIIPVIAGMLGMKPAHFAVVNIISAIGWALAYILPGVLFGASLSVAGAVSSRLAALLVILLISAWFVIWLGQKLFRLLSNQLPPRLGQLRKWAKSEIPDGHSKIRLRSIVSFFLDRTDGNGWLLLVLSAILLLAVIGLLVVVEMVLTKESVIFIDQLLYDLFQNLRTPWGDRLFVIVTEMGDTFTSTALALAVMATLLLGRCHKAAILWLITTVGGICSVLLIKFIVHSPRPISLYHGSSAFSFPSGHTTMTVILFGFTTLLITRSLTGIKRWTVVSSSLLMVLAVALSRIYLGAHWFTDVLGGLFIGTIWVSLMGLLYFKNPGVTIPVRRLGLVIVSTLILAGGWHSQQNYNTDLMKYSNQAQVQTLTVQDWLQERWQDLPLWRHNLEGDKIEPLNIQAAMAVEPLKQFLLNAGWQPAPANDLKRVLSLFSPDTPLQGLPILPKMLKGRIEKARLYKIVNNKRWVLRLWPTLYQRQDRPTKLLIGTVEVQEKYSLLGLLTLTRKRSDYAVPILSLANVFSSNKTYRVQQHTADPRAGPLLLIAPNQ